MKFFLLSSVLFKTFGGDYLLEFKRCRPIISRN